MKPPAIKFGPAPVHIVQYRNSPHINGIEFRTRATTSRGIALAAARAAREDAAYWSNDPSRAPVVTSIDFIALICRDWEDLEMWHLCDLVDTEASKFRAPKKHKSAKHPTAYTDNFLGI